MCKAKLNKKEFAEKWNSLGISNDFIFCKVMQDEELLGELIHRILPELQFSRLEITPQKPVEVGPDIHGARFDIFATEESGITIDIEMQILCDKSLPKRIRYYNSMEDMTMLDKGAGYDELCRAYVIMIMPFDYYNKGFHRYTFVNTCKEDKSLEMGEETTKIILNAVGTADDVDEKLGAFLDYVAGKTSDDEYVKKLEERVKLVKMNKKWRYEYMMACQRDLLMKRIGKEEGREEGYKVLIRKKLDKGITDPEIISDMLEIDVEKVKELLDEILVK